MNYSEDHKDHAVMWLFTLPANDVPSCLACLIHILEEKQKICVQKRPALSELHNLLHQSDEAVTTLRGNINISSQCLLVLLELLSYEDSLFVSQVLDVCMKIISKLESEELLRFMFEVIQSEVENTKDKKRLLPVYLLLGRLIQHLPVLGVVIIEDYDALLQELCQALSLADEDILSAVFYIFVHMLEGDWLTQLPSHVLQQILREVICQLNVAKTQVLIINALGLLKKLVQTDEAVQMLMRLNFDGVFLLSVLKKLLVSKNDLYQLSSVHVLSCVLSCPGSFQHSEAVLQSDIIEFLFESLHTRNTSQIGHIYSCIQYLCQLEKFYTRCHSVYGIDSILRSLEILAAMKNTGSQEEGMIILSIILTRQPSTIPLFINSVSVQFCLSIITQGIQQHHPQVFSASLQALQSIVRKDHLLLPVPFKEIEAIIGFASDRMWQNAQRNDPGILPKLEGKFTKGKGRNSTETYCQIHLAAVKLLKSCHGDPLACASSFMAPDSSKTQNDSVANFKNAILTSSSQNCIPLVMKELDDKSGPELSEHLMDLLCQLYDLDADHMTSVILKLSTAGGLAFVVNTKADFSVNHSLKQTADRCLMIMCKIVHEAESTAVHHFPFWQESTFEEVKYKLQDLPKILSQVSLSDDTKSVYLFLLYHSVKNEDLLLTGTELTKTLDMLMEGKSRAHEWSPLTQKHFIFLIAVAHSLTDSVETCDSNRQEILCEILGANTSSEIWYTHHPSLLQWTFSDQLVYRLCHDRMLEAFLHNTEVFDGAVDDDILRDSREMMLVMDLCQNKGFLNTLVGLLASSDEKVTHAAECIVQIFLDQISCDMERLEVPLYLRTKASEVAHDVFMNVAVPSKDKQLCGVLSVVLHTYQLQPGSGEAQSTDIKLIYHVIKYLAYEKTLSEAVQAKCLQYLLEVVRNHDEYSKGRVLSMLLQNEDVLCRFETQLNSDHDDHLVSLTLQLLTILLVYSASVTDFKCSKSVSLDIHPVSLIIHKDNPLLNSSYLELVAVLLDLRFCSPFVHIKHTGRFPQDPRCPFVSTDFQELYVCLQQCLLQEYGTVQSNAVRCLQALLSYLHELAPDLEKEVLQHPWNTMMLEVVLQTGLNSEATCRPHILTLIDLFLAADGIFQESKSLSVLLIECLRTFNPVDEVSAQTFQDIVSKAQMIIPKMLTANSQNMCKQDENKHTMEEELS